MIRRSVSDSTPVGVGVGPVPARAARPVAAGPRSLRRYPGRAVLIASTSIIHIGWPPVPKAADSA